jgi:hypothetical protein
MKRSEIIEIIRKTIFDTERHTYMSDSDVAYQVLEAIEEAGMFPPEHLFTSGEREGHWLMEWESESSEDFKRSPWGSGAV